MVVLFRRGGRVGEGDETAFAGAESQAGLVKIGVLSLKKVKGQLET